MPRTSKLLIGAAAVALTSSTLGTAGTVWAEPAAEPQPVNTLQAPGLAAVQQLSPAIQQAAVNPADASSLLMAAAAAFAGNSAAPDDAKRMASSVDQFVQEPPVPMPNGVPLPADLNQLLPPGVPALPGPPQAEPQAHVPAAGAGPDAHLPAGVDPAHAVGPAPDAQPAAAPTPPDAAPAPAPETPVPAAAPAPPPAPGGFGPDSPPTQDFMYPSIGSGCLSDGGNSLATVLSVAGPASIPKPGPGKGQTAYVFTAVGTPAPAAEQKLPLNVTWVNLTTGKSGTATLKPNPEINPNGPTTLTAIAETGSGSIMSTVFGQVTTVDKQCTFMPTIGSTVVP